MGDLGVLIKGLKFLRKFINHYESEWCMTFPGSGNIFFKKDKDYITPNIYHFCTLRNLNP